MGLKPSDVEMSAGVEVLPVDEKLVNTPDKNSKKYWIKSLVFTLFSMLIKFDYILQFVANRTASKILIRVFQFKKALPSLSYFHLTCS